MREGEVFKQTCSAISCLSLYWNEVVSCFMKNHRTVMFRPIKPSIDLNDY